MIKDPTINTDTSDTSFEANDAAIQRAVTDLYFKNGLKYTLNENTLKSKYNKNLYYSKSADLVNGTYLKIGPFVYGGEVQDIKILEQKAVEVLHGARSNQNLLVDAGEGRADVQVILLFSGNQHVIDGLLPLIALFHISPITSVKNKVIESALYDKYTEGAINSVDASVLDKTNKILAQTQILKEIRKVDPTFKTKGIPSKQQFDIAVRNGADVVTKDYEQWRTFLSNTDRYFDYDIHSDVVPPSDAAVKTKDESNKKVPTKHLRKIDRTGHVPMALLSIDISTHPEYIETYIVTLGLRRIHIQNYLRDGLMYRTIDNLPTPDARQAFWLNRAIDIYLDKYYNGAGGSGRQFLANASPNKLKLKYAGDDVILKSFIDSEGIVALDLQQPTKYTLDSSIDTVVQQLSIGMRNKFAFHRLTGESYPTAQHLGAMSEEVTIGIRTKSEEMFKKIHTFKSAADFFVRSVDRLDRFNGWSVDCFITRLFNDKENPEIYGPAAGLNKTYFPTSLVSSTVGDLPGVRDIIITLSETSTDFFGDFGFVLYTSGVTIDVIKTVYDTIVRGTFTDPADAYAEFMFLGTGRSIEVYSLLNPDTIVAAFLERYVYINGTFDYPQRKYQTPFSVLHDIVTNPILAGNLPGQLNVDDFINDIDPTRWPFQFSEIPLRDETVQTIYSENFTSSDQAVADQIKQYLKFITYPSGRRDLYGYLFPRLANHSVGLTNEFTEHLFSAIVRRAIPPFSDRMYSRVSVANAYDSLERALNTQYERLDAINNNSNITSAFNKSKAVDNAVTFNTDGSFAIAKKRTTAYPDFLYITYQELFDLPELASGYWKQFALTYQDLGIINPSYKSYNIDATAPLVSDSVTRAQREYITTETSPVSPSIFFYREQELSDLRNRLEESSKDWHNRLKSLTVNIPYDIEFLIKNAGKYTGEKGIIDKNGNLVPVDPSNKSQALGLASLIEAMNKYLRDQTAYGGINYRTAAEELISKQFRLAKEKLGFGNKNDKDFLEYINTTKDPSALQTYRDYINEARDIEFFVPVIYSGHANQDVAQYRKLSGLIGAAVYKSIVNTARDISGFQEQEFINNIQTRSAAGLDDGRSLTNTSAPEMHNAILKATMSIADNRFDMCKAFPTFRIFLIDYNKGDRLFVKDNFYSWSAILSIDITLDKNDAELAVIRLADPMHILQGSLFQDKLVWNKGVIGNFSLPNSPDDISDNFMARFSLKQGRAVQIRGGYSADPDNLDILFTGRIAEVEFGDVVTIIAQGWKAELISKQVDFELTSVDNSSVKDLVVRTVQDANPAGFGQSISQNDLNLVLKVIDANAVDGAWIRSAQNQYGTYGGESGYSGTRGFFGIHAFGGLGRGLDLRLKNIWVPDNEKTRFNYFADIETSGWEGRQWIVPLQPAWDVLQNATNYIWGYICQAIPFDGEATLFFGRPEQLYYYTKGNPAETKQYRQLKDNATRAFKDVSKELLEQFIGSPEHLGTNHNVFGENVSVDLKAADGLFEAISLIDANKIKSKYEPIVLGLLGYRNIYRDTSIREQTEAFGFGETSIIDFATNDLKEVNPFVNNNLRHSFISDLSSIESYIGNNNAAYLMLMSFYGFSQSYIEDNFYPGYEFVRKLLGPLTPASLGKIRQEVLDSAQHGATISQANSALALTNIAPDLASNYLAKLNAVPNSVYSQMSILPPIIKGAFGDTAEPFESISIIYNGTDKSKIPDLFAALAAYINNAPDIGAIFGKPEDIISSSSDSELRINLPIGSTVPNDLLIRLSNDARSVFNEAVNNPVVSSQSVLDQEYVQFMKHLGIIDPLDANFSNGLLRTSGGKYISDYILQNLPLFRAYVHWFAEWLTNSNGPDGNIEVTDKASEVKKTTAFIFPPSLNMKPFRDYHYIANGIEIIENNIAATTREMYNTVVVRGQKSFTTSNDAWYKIRLLQGDYDNIDVEDVEWGTWPNEEEEGHIGFQFNDSLSLENKKIGVFSDINIDLSRPDQCAKVATNVMAKYLRPMYRNNLQLMGRPIKPWDQIQLNDEYVDMIGPVEVERVVHHYSIQQGWITNVVPHLVVEANPGNSMIQRSILSNQIDKIYNTLDVALWTITALMGIPSLRAATGVGTNGAKFALQWLSKAEFLPSAATEKLAAAKFLQGFEGRAALSDAWKILKTRIAEDADPMWKAFFAAQGLEFGVGEITRAWYMSSISGNIQVPVIISPLLFKGVPFEAGVNGRETSYYSITSKVHWFLQDMKEGLYVAGRYIAAINSRPDSSRITRDLQQAAKAKQ